MFFSFYFYISVVFYVKDWKKKSKVLKSLENLSIFEFRNDYEIAYLNRVLCLSRCGAPVIIREFMKLTQDYAGLMAWFSLLINVNAKTTGVVNINKRVRERIPPSSFSQTRY